MSSYRCVGLNKLEYIFSKGVDVDPVDHEIYTTTFFDKAWEYGGWPKVAMAFDASQLEKTYIEVPSDLGSVELEKLRKTYPTLERTESGETLWLTRLSEGDPHIAKSYEIEYGRWIPGDPLNALRALIVFTDDETFSIPQTSGAELQAK